MLENLLQLVQDYGKDAVVENAEVPNEYNSAVLSEAGLAVAGTMQESINQGRFQEMLAMFDQDNDDAIMATPMAQNMQSGFIDNITSKLGINKNAAIGIAASLLPMVISKFVNRTKSTAPEDSGFDISSLIGSLTGGGGQSGGLDIGSLINQFKGNSGGGAGGLDLNNIISQFTGNNKTNNQQSGGGGLSDLIQGFFK